MDELHRWVSRTEKALDATIMALESIAETLPEQSRAIVEDAIQEAKTALYGYGGR